MPGLLEDLRYGLRSLAKSRAFSALALASLALGIGANTTVFSLVNAVFLRPLPVEDADRLVAVYTQDSKIAGLLPQSYANFQDYRALNPVFSSMTAYFSLGLSMTGRGDPVPLVGQLASGDYFSTLGLKPPVGRFFGAEEDAVPGAHPVAVLSHGFWTRHFGGDPAVPGKTIHINGWPYTVIGVAPRGFHGLNSLVLVDLWFPSMMYQRVLPNPVWFTSRRALMFSSAARLKAGVSIQQAEAALQGMATELAARFPRENQGRTIRLVPLAHASISPNQRGTLTGAGAVLMAVAGLVLLISCANVANLLLVRAGARSREFAIRVALGAGRGRIVRQMVTESVLLSLAGGALALLLARWLRDYIWTARPPMLRSLDFQIPLDNRVLAFTFGVSVLTGILFGLAPALRASRPDLTADLKDRAGVAPPSGRFNLRAILVVLQVSLSLIALVGAGLFLRSLRAAQNADLGFRTDNLAVLQFNLAMQGYNEARGREFVRQLPDRVGAVPGVLAVGLAAMPPFAGGFQRSVVVEGKDEGTSGRPTLTSAVMPGYFRAMAIPLLRGRDFTSSDAAGAPRVAIVNDVMAARYWGGENPIGRRFRFSGDDTPYEVVGIARAATYLEIGEQPRPHVYACMLQSYSPAGVVLARVAGDENAVLAAIRREFRSLDPNLAVEASTMSQSVREALWAPRLASGLLGGFGLLALTLTAVGLHGLIAYTVQLRIREFGIRMALGATPPDVVRMVVAGGVRLVALGVVLGSGIALVLSRFVRSLLFGVGPADVATFIGIPALLVVVAVAACWLPAQRATRIEPVRALRSE
jgi:macrolide transport system ATP-binding/permease protein